MQVEGVEAQSPQGTEAAGLTFSSKAQLSCAELPCAAADGRAPDCLCRAWRSADARRGFDGALCCWPPSGCFWGESGRRGGSCTKMRRQSAGWRRPTGPEAWSTALSNLEPWPTVGPREQPRGTPSEEPAAAGPRPPAAHLLEPLRPWLVRLHTACMVERGSTSSFSGPRLLSLSLLHPPTATAWTKPGELWRAVERGRVDAQPQKSSRGRLLHSLGLVRWSAVTLGVEAGAWRLGALPATKHKLDCVSCAFQRARERDKAERGGAVGA